jgi:RNA polymerase sigma factor (TIGR02999 family)
MPSSSAPDVTALLRAWRDGHPAAADQLLEVVYRDLHRQAERYMRAQPPGHTLQATGLVHEAYLRLVDRDPVDWNGRAHFFGVAAKAMRSILVDHARARGAAKRGGGADPLTLEDVEAVAGGEVRVLDLDEALSRLAELDPRKGSLVELRYFGGLSIEETAEVLGLSPATVKREWRTARAWLRRELAAESSAEPPADEPA